MAIGKDYPDWGGYPVSGQSYPLKDLAELAARLGSPVTFDRAGAVYNMETFRFGLNAWEVSKVGAAVTPAVVNTYSYSDGVSLKLDPGTVNGDYCVGQHWEPFPPLSKWGFAVRFSTAGLIGDFRIVVTLYDGTQIWQGYVRVDLGAGAIKITNSTGAQVAVATLPQLLNKAACFNYLKVVIDPETRQWVRVRLNGLSYSPAAVGLRNLGATTYEYLNLSLQAVSGGAGQGAFYADDVVLTYNES